MSVYRQMRLMVLGLGLTSGLVLANLGDDTVPATTAPAAHPRTTTTTLPIKTNNAWDLPAFQLPGLDGQSHSLSDWKGKVILLNFWASWCAPCQAEIKDFVRYQDQYGERGLQIVSLGLDEARKLGNVQRTLGINYPVLVADPVNDAGILDDWGNAKQIVPYTVVIGRDGRLNYIHRGQLDDNSFREFVLPLL